MKIGLIGAPGCGKTHLANELAERLGDTHIIDGYAERYEERSGIATGMVGGYIANIGVALERIGEEVQAAGKGYPNTITCGTLIDTTLYIGMMVAIQNNQSVAYRTQAMMDIFAHLYHDTFVYDGVFYIPLLTGEAGQFDFEFNQELGWALDSWDKGDIVTLTPEDQTSQIVNYLEVKRAARDNQAKVAD